MTARQDMLEVRNPFDDQVVGIVARTPADAVSMLVETASAGARVGAAMPRHRRAEILLKAASAIASDTERFAQLIVQEAGKTIRQARREVLRCVNTLTLSAEEAKRHAGEVLPFDSFPGAEMRQGWFTREPLGIVVAITPYNDPLNLVAHKLGPAIAAGNAVILKPSELAPLSALELAKVLHMCGLPHEMLSVAVGDARLGQALVSARAVRMVSFTGGFKTGEAIARAAGLKKLAMDLGGNAAVIVMDDCDLEQAVARCVSGAFWAAGQNCIGTQRILVQRRCHGAFRDAFVETTRRLVTGDPAHAHTDVGPMIHADAAARIAGLVDVAIAEGARVLHGHLRDGAVYLPTVLEDVSHDGRLWTEEAFAPVVALEPFDSLEQAISLANRPDFSLHAGIFTRDLEVALRACRELEAGGVMVNDSSDYRHDAMPFGGSKHGSMGREGVRFAYEVMTQPKVVCIHRGRISA
jgi:acyl-CoA reductase-like NAD-dependent aldehyde dehydrogenase